MDLFLASTFLPYTSLSYVSFPLSFFAISFIFLLHLPYYRHINTSYALPSFPPHITVPAYTGWLIHPLALSLHRTTLLTCCSRVGSVMGGGGRGHWPFPPWPFTSTMSWPIRPSTPKSTRPLMCFWRPSRFELTLSNFDFQGSGALWASSSLQSSLACQDVGLLLFYLPQAHLTNWRSIKFALA